MRKIFRIGLAALLLLFAAGDIFAENNAAYSFGFNQFQTTEFNTSLQFDFIANGMNGGSSGFMTQSPVVAGLLNVPLGLWSWMNRDWFGGGMVAGLEAGGLALFLYINSSEGSADLTRLILGYGGLGLCIGGAIGGAVRAYTICQTMNMAATGFNGNPLEKISFGVVPGIGGSIVYKTSL